MTVDDPSVTVETVGAVSVVTLRNPPHNLLTEPLLRAVADALHHRTPGVRAMVLCSVGRSFCAGANFRSGDAPDPSVGGTFTERTGAFYLQAARIFQSPVPVVAAYKEPPSAPASASPWRVTCASWARRPGSRRTSCGSVSTPVSP
jgi:enoyl-CoA hydratase/carnithine racemase